MSSEKVLFKARVLVQVRAVSPFPKPGTVVFVVEKIKPMSNDDIIWYSCKVSLTETNKYSFNQKEIRILRVSDYLQELKNA